MKTTFEQIIISHLKKLFLPIVVVFALAFPAQVFASTYGCGGYGDNTYNNSCKTTSGGTTGTTTEPTPSPTPSTEESPTVSPTTPSPSPTPSTAKTASTTGKSSWTTQRIALVTLFALAALGGLSWLIILLIRRRRGNWDNPTTINPQQ